MVGLLLPTLTALLGSTLLFRAAAHQCSDGSRVRCTDVIATPDSPSTYGQGFGAHGSSHCTPSGEKVFCLVDHDYHRCSGDQLPCCSDGSDPYHSRHYSGSSSSAEHTLACGAVKPPEPLSQPSAALLAKMTQLPGPSAGSSVLKEGSLVLSVSLKTPASGSSAEIFQFLVRHGSAAIRVGLASNFEVSLAAVKIMSVKSLARRRLLDVLEGPQKFKISFTAEVPEGIVEKARSRPLAADLKEALDVAESGLAVESASLEWKTATAVYSGGGSCTFVYIVLGACCSATVLCGLVAACWRTCRRGAVASEPTQTEVTSKSEKADIEKQDDDEEASNAPSTQEPSEGDENRSIGSQASPDVEEPKK